MVIYSKGEALEKYQSQKEELERMCKVKANVVFVVVEILEGVTPKMEEWLKQIPGTMTEQNPETPRPLVEVMM